MSAASPALWLAAAIVLPALPVPAAVAANRPEPLKVHLEEVAQSAVQGFPVEDVEAVLRKEFRGRKTIVLVPTPEEAALVLRVTECVGWAEKRRINEANERKVATNRGLEAVYGVRTEYRTHVVLIVRATWSEHFEDLQAADDDRNLKSAADTVAIALDQLVKRRLRSH